MQVRVLFFGATADETGKRSMEFPIEDSVAAQTAFEQILRSFPKLSSHKLLFAVNQEYITDDRILQDGDELAIFTAVSGG
jgi:molybdopterin converting factor subunit 1